MCRLKVSWAHGRNTLNNKPFQGVGYKATAFAIMQRVYDEGMAAGKSPEEISREITNAYPWVVRAGWRYKQWIVVRKQFFTEKNLPGLRGRKSLKELAQESGLLPSVGESGGKSDG